MGLGWGWEGESVNALFATPPVGHRHLPAVNGTPSHGGPSEFVWVRRAVSTSGSHEDSIRATVSRMDPASVREFARRNRAEVQALRQQYWVQQYRSEGPARTIRVSLALWQFVRRLRPDWPTARDRAEDLAHHVESKRRIDRAAHGLAAR